MVSVNVDRTSPMKRGRSSSAAVSVPHAGMVEGLRNHPKNGASQKGEYQRP